MIKKLNRNLVDFQSSSVYDFNELTLQDLLSKFFDKINNCIDVSNQALSFLEWLKEEGLPIEVQKEIEKMYLDGRLTQIINDLADNVNEKVDNVLLYQSEKPLSDYNKVWIEDVTEEVLGELPYVEKEIDRVTNKLKEIDTKVTTELNEFSLQLEQKANKGKSIRTVAKAGGDYNTIMGAVNAGGDTASEPITIQVFPGVYEEQVYIKQWTRMNLVGLNKKDCIIVNHGGGYTDEPFITAGERYIANITFRATHEKSTTTDKNQWKSYAFHGDKSSGGDGTTLIENCRFESYHNASVGLGIYNNQKFHFKNCEFYSKIDYDSSQADVGAFFAHNSVTSGVTNGELILENCTFFMDNDRFGYGKACYINDANLTNGDGLGNAIKVKFINCTLKRNVGGHVNALRVDNVSSINNLSGSILLEQSSNGNNIAQLNSPQFIWIEPSLPSEITNVGSNFTPLRYTKDMNGKVRVEGTVAGLSSGATTTLFTLPIGYRPKYHKFYDIVNYNNETPQIGKLLINRSGTVTIEGTLNTARTDICVEFYAEQ